MPGSFTLGSPADESAFPPLGCGPGAFTVGGSTFTDGSGVSLTDGSEGSFTDGTGAIGFIDGSGVGVSGVILGTSGAGTGTGINGPSVASASEHPFSPVHSMKAW